MNPQSTNIASRPESASNTKKVLTTSIPLCILTISCVIFSTRESNYLFGKKIGVTRLRQQSYKELFAPKKEAINSLARPFKYQPDYNWCVQQESFNGSSPTGLLFVKVPKTGEFDGKALEECYISYLLFRSRNSFLTLLLKL